MSVIEYECDFGECNYCNTTSVKSTVCEPTHARFEVCDNKKCNKRYDHEVQNHLKKFYTYVETENSPTTNYLLNDFKFNERIEVAESKGLIIGFYKLAMATYFINVRKNRWKCFSEWKQMEDYKYYLEAVKLAKKVIEEYAYNPDEIFLEIREELVSFYDTEGDIDSLNMDDFLLSIAERKNPHLF